MVEVVCAQPDCQLPKSGRCLEGFDPPETCPYRTGQLRAIDDTVEFVEQDLVTLPSGEALTERQAAEITRLGATNLVVIAGPTDSGKTTILAALFEAFQEAPFGNYLFAGSRTLVGFEQRCHLGRRESGQEVAKTAHTSVREGVAFLHLDLAFRDESRLSHRHLLLSDISGELFKRIRDSSDAANDVASLGRADHFCIVVDGQRLVDTETRQSTKSDSRSILRSVIESGKLSTSCMIDLVITKWDLITRVLQEQGDSTIRSFLNETIRAVTAVAGDRQITVHEVAARPPVDAKVPFAHGLPTLLRSWMGHDQHGPKKMSVYSVSGSQRDFNRYTDTVLTSYGLAEAYEHTQI